ncbi:hypothetical protein GGX14DRAFT_404566 [Mycena pura]|uniref:Uncharacterized protein n=1 Tax=Mycena pura TaxID=153505 RepID=A0AAD6UU11_9AGAR|nr:hypothetical protein GGX14DRAFT_404566 [Mycena pura]
MRHTLHPGSTLLHLGPSPTERVGSHGTRKSCVTGSEKKMENNWGGNALMPAQLRHPSWGGGGTEQHGIAKRSCRGAAYQLHSSRVAQPPWLRHHTTRSASPPPEVAQLHALGEMKKAAEGDATEHAMSSARAGAIVETKSKNFQLSGKVSGFCVTLGTQVRNFLMRTFLLRNFFDAKLSSATLLRGWPPGRLSSGRESQEPKAGMQWQSTRTQRAKDSEWNKKKFEPNGEELRELCPVQFLFKLSHTLWLNWAVTSRVPAGFNPYGFLKPVTKKSRTRYHYGKCQKPADTRAELYESKIGAGGWVSKFVEVELEERLEDTALSVRSQFGCADPLLSGRADQRRRLRHADLWLSQIIEDYFYIRRSVSTGFGVSRCVNPYGDACSESLCGLSAALSHLKSFASKKFRNKKFRIKNEKASHQKVLHLSSESRAKAETFPLGWKFFDFASGGIKVDNTMEKQPEKFRKSKKSVGLLNVHLDRHSQYVLIRKAIRKPLIRDALSISQSTCFPYRILLRVPGSAFQSTFSFETHVRSYSTDAAGSSFDDGAIYFFWHRIQKVLDAQLPPLLAAHCELCHHLDFHLRDMVVVDSGTTDLTILRRL